MITAIVQPPLPPVPAETPRPRSLDELYEVLQMYNEVTQKLQLSHDRLQAEVVRLNEQLEQKNRELERKKRLAALGEMAAGIAHEIRNPLGGIQLYANTLLNDVADRPQAADLVRKISAGVKGLNTLVSDMLTFTRDLNLQKEDASLVEIIEHAVELAGPVFTHNRVTVQLDPSLNGTTARVDPRLLGRVLLNLLMNAAEAVGENLAPSDTGLITLSVQRVQDRTLLTIEDNGPGIPESSIEQIFHPFFTTKHSGTGLGLAIVHRIIEAHGGSITAENQPAPRHGARFKITL